MHTSSCNADSVTDGCQLRPEVQWLSHQAFLQPQGERREPAPGVQCYNPAPVWAFRAAFVLIVLFVGRRCRGYGGPEHRHGLDGVFKS